MKAILKIEIEVDIESKDLMSKIIDEMDIDISYISKKDEGGKQREMITYIELKDYKII